MTAICTSELYSNQTICEVINQLQDLLVVATDLRGDADTKISNLATTVNDGLTDVTAYLADTSGVSKTFSAPSSPSAPDYSSSKPSVAALPTEPSETALDALGTAPQPADLVPVEYSGAGSHSVSARPSLLDLSLPVQPTIGTFSVDSVPVIDTHTVTSAPTVSSYSGASAPTIGQYSGVDDPPVVPDAYVVPDATTALITTGTIDSIFNRAVAKVARVGVKEEWDAQSYAASMGLGLPSTSLAKRLAEAQQRTNDRTSEVALEQAIQEGVWKREDVKTLHGFHIQNWAQKPKQDFETWNAKESLDIEAYKAGQLWLDSWNVSARINFEAWNAESRLDLDSWSAESRLSFDVWRETQALDVQSYGISAPLELDAQKTVKQLDVAVWDKQADGEIAEHGVNTSATSATYGTEEGLRSEVYRADESNKIQAHNTDENVKVGAHNAKANAYGMESRAKIDSYRAQNSVDIDIYNAIANAVTQRFGAEVQWELGYRSAESARLDALRSVFVAEIQSEGERRGWSQMEINEILEKADKLNASTLKKAQILYDSLITTTASVAEMYFTAMNGVYSAANYQLQGYGGQTVSENISS